MIKQKQVCKWSLPKQDVTDSPHTKHIGFDCDWQVGGATQNLQRSGVRNTFKLLIVHLKNLKSK